MLPVHTLDNRRLENFLERHKAYAEYSGEIDIDVFLREILQKANEFVPSEAGSILLDDPLTKNNENRMENEIVFIATFGADAETRLARRINARVGIAGHVYSTGVTYRTEDVIEGVVRFLRRLWRAVHEVAEQAPRQGSDGARTRKAHETIAKATDDIDRRFQFHTPISAVMELVNELADDTAAPGLRPTPVRPAISAASIAPRPPGVGEAAAIAEAAM